MCNSYRYRTCFVGLCFLFPVLWAQDSKFFPPIQRVQNVRHRAEGVDEAARFKTKAGSLDEIAARKEGGEVELSFEKLLSEPKVLQSLTEAMAQAHFFVTELGAYPHKTYSLDSAEGRFAMRSMTYQVAKKLHAEPQLAPYFTLTKKVENIFHELRFENFVVREKDKIRGAFFRSYFRLRHPNSEKSFVFMLEWNPQDKSSEGLKLFSIASAVDAWSLAEGATRSRIGLHREELGAMSKAHSNLQAYLSSLNDGSGTSSASTRSE